MRINDGKFFTVAKVGPKITSITNVNYKVSFLAALYLIRNSAFSYCIMKFCYDWRDLFFIEMVAEMHLQKEL